MSADTSASVRPTSGICAAVELVGDAVGGGAGGAQGVDLGGVLDHAQRPDDVDGPAERRARQLRQQLDEEPGPHLVADGDASTRRAASPATIAVGSSVSLPRPQREHARLLDDPRRLEPRHDHRGVAVARHDEHRQALQRHRLVPGQVRQVVADRHQQHVDAQVGHRLAHPVQAAVDGTIVAGVVSTSASATDATGVTCSAADLAW